MHDMSRRHTPWQIVDLTDNAVKKRGAAALTQAFAQCPVRGCRVDGVRDASRR